MDDMRTKLAKLLYFLFILAVIVIFPAFLVFADVFTIENDLVTFIGYLSFNISLIYIVTYMLGDRYESMLAGFSGFCLSVAIFGFITAFFMNINSYFPFDFSVRKYIVVSSLSSLILSGLFGIIATVKINKR